MKWLRDFFNINRRQERGMWFLALLLLVAVLVLYLSNFIFKTPFEPYDAALQARIDSLEWVKQHDIKGSSISKHTKQRSKYSKPLKPFVFDPNTVTQEALLEMNLPKRLVKQWINYRQKGGRFATVEAVGKLYAMDSATFATLKPYMRFETVVDAKSSPKHTKAQRKPLPKEIKTDKKEVLPVLVKDKPLHMGINTADSISLLQVKGIGPYYAGAIVKYRERLGGYVDRTQLMELYNMDENRYRLWCKSLYLDSVPVTQLSVNTATFKNLLRHPYIDYNTTKYIVNKRRKLGKFAALYQLKDDKMMPDSLYRKLLPYLCL